LIKYATVQYTSDDGEACIERMMKTYEVCVSKHGKSQFMSDLVTVSSNEVRPILVSVAKNKTIILVVIITVVGFGAIGGYFFMKSKRKENSR